MKKTEYWNIALKSLESADFFAFHFVFRFFFKKWNVDKTEQKTERFFDFHLMSKKKDEWQELNTLPDGNAIW